MSFPCDCLRAGLTAVDRAKFRAAGVDGITLQRLAEQDLEGPSPLELSSALRRTQLLAHLAHATSLNPPPPTLVTPPPLVRPAEKVRTASTACEAFSTRRLCSHRSALPFFTLLAACCAFDSQKSGGAADDPATNSQPGTHGSSAHRSAVIVEAAKASSPGKYKAGGGFSPPSSPLAGPSDAIYRALEAERAAEAAEVQVLLLKLKHQAATDRLAASLHAAKLELFLIDQKAMQAKQRADGQRANGQETKGGWAPAQQKLARPSTHVLAAMPLDQMLAEFDRRRAKRGLRPTPRGPSL